MPRPLPHNSNPPRQVAEPPRQVAEPPRQHQIGFGQILLIFAFIGGLFLFFNRGNLPSSTTPDRGLSSVSTASNANNSTTLDRRTILQATPLPYTPSNTNMGTIPLNNRDSCTPATIFIVGESVVADSSGQRLIAWTQPGGNVQDSEAEPGMKINIIGGPRCVYNNRQSQYVRYWQVEFNNRNGRLVLGWVAESIWEGNSLNYLICPRSNADC